MRFPTLWALALGAFPVHAFRDTSPFMFFSTSEILFDSPEITTAKTLTSSFSSALRACPSKYYVLLNQPGVHSEDYSKDGPTPHLQRRIKGEDKGIRSSHAVAEVRDEVDRAALEMILRKSCGADMVQVDAKAGPIQGLEGPGAKVIKVDLPAPPSKGAERTSSLRENDLWLSTLLESFPSSNYTVVYTTTPSAKTSDVSQEEPGVYQMDSTMSPLGHLELKRDLGARQQGSKNLTLVDGPLFERYQYFTPGIFMGLLTLIFLASILYIAISAVASLQVSYAAFDKETGPTQQKKQQ